MWNRLLLFCGTLLLAAARLQAQEEWTPPVINFSPGTYTSPTATLAVQVSFSDQSALVSSSRWIKLNHVDVTANFSWEPSGSTLAYANDEVTLQLGSNVVEAYICDEWSNCSSNSVTYTYDPATYSVAVTPDNGGAYPRASSTRQQQFAVKNTGTGSATFALSTNCASAPIAGACSLAPSSLTLAPDSIGTATVTYTSSGTVGSSGPIKLFAQKNNNALVKDSAWVTITVGSHQKSTVAVSTVNPGTSVERDLCLAIAAGSSAMIECGDLRLAHSLPTTRTMNKARSPTLIYSSAHAHPHAIVAANVSLPTGAGWPDSTIGVLTVGGVEKVRTKWDGNGWIPGRASRVALGYDAFNDPTGVYSYKVKVTNWYAGTAQPADSASGDLVIVNRKSSAFGAGWWLAGLEQLDTATMVWTGGDGSMRKYVATGTPNVWAAATVDRPDTLKFVTNWVFYDPVTEQLSFGSAYVRYLPHGVRVVFNPGGAHVETKNRLGHTTRFEYTTGVLSRIRLPIRNDGVGPRYDFRYVSGVLDSVLTVASGAANRVVDVTSSGARLTSIRDPDNTIVSFGYDGTTNRVVSRTDRRGKVRHFRYDDGKKVVADSLPLTSPAALIKTAFRPLESLGLASAIDTGMATSRLDGPRTDVGDTTHFWLDRFGAPRKIVNAQGDSTVLTRDNGTFPSLVTELRAPNGFVTRAMYDSRGNIDSLRAVNAYGTGQDAVTTYRWDAKWDFVTKIDPPLHDSVTVSYDTTTGNRLSQDDARGSSSRVEFRYDASCKLLRAADAPLTAPDSVAYDGSCNVSDTYTPLGVRSQFYQDSWGKDTLAITKIGAGASETLTQRFKYDAVDRDTAAITIGASLTDSITTPAETLFVSKSFDQEGNLLSLKRWSRPDSTQIGTITTQWAYDSANRVIWEQAPDNQRDSMRYDPAGNLTSWKTRRGKEVTNTFDTVNRLLRRVVPSVVYAETTACPICTAVVFPGRNIPKDSTEFGYDALGNIVKANNYAARISRAFAPNGTIAADTIRIGTWLDAADSTTHIYGLRYGYDLNGRRQWMKHPATIAPHASGVVKDSVAYEYWSHGPLKTVRDVLGNASTYFYDLENRVDSVAKPGSVGEKLVYDGGSRLVRRLVRAPNYTSVFHSDTVFKDTLTYDVRDKIRTVAARTPGGPSTPEFFRYWYSGLGTVVRTDVSGGSDEEWRTDALGNYRYKIAQTPSSGTPQHLYTYQPSVGRLLKGVAPSVAINHPDTTQHVYDPSGNLSFTRNVQIVASQYHEDDVRNYYTADERLHAADRYVAPTSTTPTRVVEEYRYDALGRRVLVQQDNVAQGLEHIYPDFLERTVWDGDQVLYEIRYPHPQESDTTTPSSTRAMFGRVAYSHGLGIDQPQSLVRVGYQGLPDAFAFMPHLNWRGVIAMGTFDDGKAEKCSVGGGTCVQVIYPAAASGTYFDESQVTQPQSWMGNLITKHRSGSGQLYSRNRYYDPLSGRFTQEDPVGLAGGLNLYGFANGDPVNNTDPFGLCAAVIDCPVTVVGGVTAGKFLFAAAATGVAAGSAWVALNWDRLKAKARRVLGTIGTVIGTAVSEGEVAKDIFERERIRREQEEEIRRQREEEGRGSGSGGSGGGDGGDGGGDGGGSPP